MHPFDGVPKSDRRCPWDISLICCDMNRNYRALHITTVKTGLQLSVRCKVIKRVYAVAKQLVIDQNLRGWRNLKFSSYRVDDCLGSRVDQRPCGSKDNIGRIGKAHGAHNGCAPNCASNVCFDLHRHSRKLIWDLCCRRLDS